MGKMKLKAKPRDVYDDPETSVMIPVPVRDMALALAKRDGLPLYAVFAIGVVALQADPKPLRMPGIKGRYPMRKCVSRSWLTVERRVYAVVRDQAGLTAEAIRSQTDTLTLGQVRRALANGVERRLIKESGGTYDWAKPERR